MTGWGQPGILADGRDIWPIPAEVLLCAFYRWAGRVRPPRWAVRWISLTLSTARPTVNSHHLGISHGPIPYYNRGLADISWWYTNCVGARNAMLPSYCPAYSCLPSRPLQCIINTIDGLAGCQLIPDRYTILTNRRCMWFNSSPIFQTLGNLQSTLDLPFRPWGPSYLNRSWNFCGRHRILIHHFPLPDLQLSMGHCNTENMSSTQWVVAFQWAEWSQ